MSDYDEGIFRIPARRCKRCGGLLTSAQALKDGYGHTCKMKVRHEELAKEEAKISTAYLTRQRRVNCLELVHTNPPFPVLGNRRS